MKKIIISKGKMCSKNRDERKCKEKDNQVKVFEGIENGQIILEIIIMTVIVKNQKNRRKKILKMNK